MRAETFYDQVGIDYNHERVKRCGHAASSPSSLGLSIRRQGVGKMRNCLRCSTPFRSAGHGNRVCSDCVRKNAREGRLAAEIPVAVRRGAPE
jgi:hypothetical protein